MKKQVKKTAKPATKTVAKKKSVVQKATTAKKKTASKIIKNTKKVTK